MSDEMNITLKPKYNDFIKIIDNYKEEENNNEAVINEINSLTRNSEKNTENKKKPKEGIIKKATFGVL